MKLANNKKEKCINNLSCKGSSSNAGLCWSLTVKQGVSARCIPNLSWPHKLTHGASALITIPTILQMRELRHRVKRDLHKVSRYAVSQGHCLNQPHTVCLWDHSADLVLCEEGGDTREKARKDNPITCDSLGGPFKLVLRNCRAVDFNAAEKIPPQV